MTTNKGPKYVWEVIHIWYKVPPILWSFQIDIHSERNNSIPIFECEIDEILCAHVLDLDYILCAVMHVNKTWWDLEKKTNHTNYNFVITVNNLNYDLSMNWLTHLIWVLRRKHPPRAATCSICCVILSSFLCTYVSYKIFLCTVWHI